MKLLDFFEAWDACNEYPECIRDGGSGCSVCNTYPQEYSFATDHKWVENPKDPRKRMACRIWLTRPGFLFRQQLKGDYT